MKTERKEKQKHFLGHKADTSFWQADLPVRVARQTPQRVTARWGVWVVQANFRIASSDSPALVILSSRT